MLNPFLHDIPHVGKEIFFSTLTRGQEMIQVVGVIVLKFGFVQPIYFEQKMIVAIPPLQTKYVANIKRMWGKIEVLSAFEVINPIVVIFEAVATTSYPTDF